jgi:hypothetical protein
LTLVAAMGAGCGGTPSGSRPVPTTVPAWSKPHAIATGIQFVEISCASSDFCVAAGSPQGTVSSGDFSIYDGSTWGKAVPVDKVGLYEVSCPSRRFCAMLGENGDDSEAIEINGSASGTPRIAALPVQMTSISCASASFCLAVGGVDDQSVDPPTVAVETTFDGQSWSQLKGLFKGGGLASVSCVSANFCMAVGSGVPSTPLSISTAPGIAEYYEGSSWGRGEAIDPDEGLVSVSCASSSLCVALGNPSDAGLVAPTDVLTFDGSTWSKPTRPDGSSHVIEALSCAPGGPCIAVDDAGKLLSFDGLSWKTSGKVDTTTMTSLSCVSSSFCGGIDLRSDATFERLP